MLQETDVIPATNYIATMKTYFASLLGIALFAGCSLRVTPDQKKYMRELISTPSEFMIPQTKVAESRGKAQVWLARYTEMKPQIMTDYVVITYTGMAQGDYSYVVTFEPLGDSVKVAVSCRSSGSWDIDYKMRKIVDDEGIKDDEWNPPHIDLRNEKILAYYLQTGKNPFPELIEW